MDETIDREAHEIERWCQSYDLPCAPGIRPGDELSNQIRGLWERAPNWHTMIELNRRYLQRRLPVCAGYGMPPEEETDRFAKLLRLHDYGVISTNSCPGWMKQLDHSPAFSRQRAFLTFSIPTRTLFANTPNALCNFVEKLSKSEELYAFVRFKYDNAPHGVQRHREIISLMEFGYCCSFPDSTSKEWEMEKWRLGGDDEDTGFLVPQEQRRQNSQAWYHHGHTSVDFSGSDFEDDDEPFPASHAEDPLQISVIAKDWDYREIGESIERLLIDSGIVPGFVTRG